MDPKPPPAPGAVPPVSEAEIAQVRAEIVALERTMKTRHLYPPEHPQTDQACNGLVLKMADFFREYDELRVAVSNEDFIFAKHPLLPDPGVHNNLPFRLFKDGIREFIIVRGVSLQEFLDFLGCLDEEDDEESADEWKEDLVTLFWNCGFQYIDFLVVDEFDDIAPGSTQPGSGYGGDADRSELIRRVKDHVVAYKRNRNLASGISPDALKIAPDLRSVDPNSVPEVTALLQKSPDETARRFHELVEGEHLGTSMGRTIDVLMDMLEKGTENDVKLTLKFLQATVGYYMNRRDYAAIGHLFKRVKFQQLMPRIPELKDLLRGLENELHSPKLPLHMVTYLNRRFKGDLEGLRNFFEALGLNAAKVLVEVYSSVLSGRTRALLREFLIKFGKTDTEPLRALMKAPDGILPEVIDMLDQVRPSWMAHELQPMLKHPIIPLRFQAIALLGKINGLARTKVLLNLVQDPDVRVRIHALRTLGDAKDQGTLMFVREWIDHKDFVGRSKDEKFATLAAYASIGGELVLPFLKTLAERKLPLLGKDRVKELREAALMAIGSMPFPSSQQALKTYAEKGDDHVKPFVEILLKGGQTKTYA